MTSSDAIPRSACSFRSASSRMLFTAAMLRSPITSRSADVCKDCTPPEEEYMATSSLIRPA